PSPSRSQRPCPRPAPPTAPASRPTWRSPSQRHGPETPPTSRPTARCTPSQTTTPGSPSAKSTRPSTEGEHREQDLPPPWFGVGAHGLVLLVVGLTSRQEIVMPERVRELMTLNTLDPRAPFVLDTHELGRRPGSSQRMALTF